MLPLTTAVATAQARDGHPNLTGFYDSGTLTPLNRPEYFGDKQFMTRKEANTIIARTQASFASQRGSDR
jgi:hypothetical protein|tara:strand:- start:715 stop:921 length:207 start_codon:yes stop_codon:yes gene_type:complete